MKFFLRRDGDVGSSFYDSSCSLYYSVSVATLSYILECSEGCSGRERWDGSSFSDGLSVEKSEFLWFLLIWVVGCWCWKSRKVGLSIGMASLKRWS